MPDPATPSPDDLFAFQPLQSTLLTPETVPISPGGYIDDAVPRTMFRARFDAAYRINHADRAEFLYTTWRVFGGKARNPPNGFPDGGIDSQSFALYYEYALNSNASVFAEVQALLSDPTRSGNHGGFGDMIAGFKWVLRSDECSILTFQLKNYIPTGSEDNWLTAGHYSIEPGLLYARQLSERTALVAELRDWISVDGAEFRGEDYAGNVLRYGVGLTYL
ncbi:MAG: hypothetical protein IH899_01505, partial [Planctomycetes bacterium]|nr:hypothetical protein [Planctomycetota bacterium]